MSKTKQCLAMTALLALVAVAAFGQPVRKDAIWARMVPAGTMTLDGLLNEPAWAKAESLVVKWGQNNGDPGSGYRGEYGLNGGTTPTDPTNAVIKFLVSSENKMYVAVVCNDKSIGGGLFNQFDGFLMNIRDRSKTDRPVPPYEYFYGWVTEPWADTTTGYKGASPGFFGWAGGKRTDSTGGVPNSKIWNAKTKVYGVTNDDSKPDTAWVTELEFDLGIRGYDVTKAGGDIVQYSMSIYDADYEWPLDTTKVSGNRTWVQCPWSNAAAYSHLRVFANPTVTTTTSTVPAFGYDLTIYNATGQTPPVLDGALNDAVWSKVPGFDIRFGDNTLRGTYKNTMPYRSGQFQPDVYGKKATVLDPADATVKMFYIGDTLYVGVNARDKVVQYRPEFDRQDGFDLILRDRTESNRDAAEHILATKEFYVRADSSAKKYAIERDAPVYASDTIAAAGRGSRFALALKTGTAIDTMATVSDSGYTVEMKINLRSLGYPAGRGDGILYLGALVNDGDTFGSTPTIAPYGNRVWFATDGGWNDGPAFAYMDPSATLTAVEGKGTGEVPGEFQLHGVYPNPFNPATTIEFSLPKMANVRIVVYDILGRTVATRTLSGLGVGRQGYRFDASALSSGTYLFRVEMLDLQTGDVLGQHTGKMMLLK